MPQRATTASGWLPSVTVRGAAGPSPERLRTPSRASRGPPASACFDSRRAASGPTPAKHRRQRPTRRQNPNMFRTGRPGPSPRPCATRFPSPALPRDSTAGARPVRLARSYKAALPGNPPGRASPRSPFRKRSPPTRIDPRAHPRRSPELVPETCSSACPSCRRPASSAAK